MPISYSTEKSPNTCIKSSRTHSSTIRAWKTLSGACVGGRKHGDYRIRPSGSLRDRSPSRRSLRPRFDWRRQMLYVMNSCQTSCCSDRRDVKVLDKRSGQWEYDNKSYCEIEMISLFYIITYASGPD